MKNTTENNIQILLRTISPLTGDIARKTIINAAVDAGLTEKDTYPLLKPVSKGNSRGTYNVDKMIELADKILNKGGNVDSAPKKVIQPTVKEMVKAYVEKSPTKKIEDEVVETKIYGNSSWGELAYTEDDINEELNLMATYL